jgi:hypothetical protein
VSKQYYKVLDSQGRSCDGGDYTWSLPTQAADGTWTPGAWAEIPAHQSIQLCRSGFHLTADPVAGGWYQHHECGRVIWVAEYEGDVAGPVENGDKIACRRVRLVRGVNAADLVAIRIVSSGVHNASSGAWLAYGSATVTAYGSATVRAYGSATVRAYGSATVRAYGSATVRAYGSATVTADGSATVTAYGSATVTAYGSATVRAYGSATVRAYGSATVTADGSATVTAYGSATVTAYGSATVRAYGSATVTADGSATVTAYGSATVTAKGRSTVSVWCGNPKVKLREYALRIDRRVSPPKVYRAKRKA